MSTFDERAAWIYEIRESVKSSEIETASRKTLTKYSAWLCDPDMRSQSFGGEYDQLCELVRLHMLRTMIDAFEDRSKIMQYWLLFFAVLAIVATIFPYFIAPNPSNSSKPAPTESISKTEVAPSPSQAQSMSAPIHVPPPSTHPTAMQGKP